MGIHGFHEELKLPAARRRQHVQKTMLHPSAAAWAWV